MHTFLFPGIRLARGASHLVVVDTPKKKATTKKPAVKRKPRALKKTVTTSIEQSATPHAVGQAAAGQIPAHTSSPVFDDETSGGHYDYPDDSLPFEALSSKPPQPVFTGQRKSASGTNGSMKLEAECRMPPTSEPDVGSEGAAPMRLFDLEELNANT